MSLSSLFQNLHNLGGNLMAIWNFVTHAYHRLADWISHVLSLFDRIHTLIENVETEIQAIRDFEFDPRWRTRVISVPRAYEKLHRLAVDIPSEITSAVKDLVSKLREKINASAPESDFTPEELDKDLKLLPEKLAKCGEKILGVITLLFDTVETISGVVDDLQTLVSDFREIREDIENLDAIFLPRGNPRQVVDTRYRKRVSV